MPVFFCSSAEFSLISGTGFHKAEVGDPPKKNRLPFEGKPVTNLGLLNQNTTKLENSLVKHSVGNFEETGNVCTLNVVYKTAAVFSVLNACTVNVAHDLM